MYLRSTTNSKLQVTFTQSMIIHLANQHLDLSKARKDQDPVGWYRFMAKVSVVITAILLLRVFC
jgi:hypothetical protein